MAEALVYTHYQVAILTGRRNQKSRTALNMTGGDQYALCGIFDGSGELTKEGGNSQLIQAPTAVLLTPNDGYRLTTAAGVQWEMLSFDIAFVPRRRLKEGSKALVHIEAKSQPDPMTMWGVVPPTIIPEEHIKACLNALRFCGRYWWTKKMGYPRANARLAHWLTEYVASYIKEPKSDLPWLQKINKIINAGGTHGRITVSELATTLNISRQQLHRLFCQEVGMTPQAYLNKMRMEVAANMLQSGDWAVNDVSMACGYSSRSAFAAQFENFHGMTPAAYAKYWQNPTS